MRDDDETVTFAEVHAIRATELALLCKFHDGREVWVPQSQIHDDSEVFAVGDKGKLIVAEWWVQREGLEV